MYFVGNGIICGRGRSVEHEGYCYGTVNNNTQNACHNIFAEGSKLTIINSAKTQDFLKDSMSILKIEYRHQYSIGLMYNSTSGSTILTWHDGTPVTFNNFRWPPEISDTSIDYCVSMDYEDSMQWREYECDQTQIQRASMCQIGELKICS